MKFLDGKARIVLVIVLALAVLWYLCRGADEGAAPGLLGTMASGLTQAVGLGDPPTAKVDKLVSEISALQKKTMGIAAHTP